MKYFDLSGKWKVELSDGTKGEALLPGTLDENLIGKRAAGEPISTRLTRRFSYEGEAAFISVLDMELPARKRVFLEAERSRSLRLFVDGEEIPALRGTLSTPYLFEATALLRKGSEIRLVSDNSYKGLPREDIVNSSAATDETQTNWNGILGFFRLRIEEAAFIESLQVANTVAILRINSLVRGLGRVRLHSDAFREDQVRDVELRRGIWEIKIEDIPLKKDAAKWDEYAGELCKVMAELELGQVFSEAEGCFGIRDFGDDGRGHLQLNGRRVFLRSEANCCVFPETGHSPMDVDSWRKIIKTYMAYGVNCLRFHSHCPPDAAFTAADELGVLVQPELSDWNPKDAFGSAKARRYYEREALEIIRTYGGHPSFVMLSFGNELQAGEEGEEFAHTLLKRCRELDPTRLYAISSNYFYGEKGCDEESDFYTAMRYRELPLRATFDGMKGHLNNEYPGAFRNYDRAMEEIRKSYGGPVFSFEVGQYEVLPDFDEIDEFKGVTAPDNFELIRRRAAEKGLLRRWKSYVEATGELALLCYKEEVEAALRTGDYSGISLLGLQDFPGQGTALVGMLDSHLESKPYSFAEPRRFNSFFRQVLPLVYLEKYTYTNKETLRAGIKLANYSSREISGTAEYRLARDGECLFSENSSEVNCSPGGLTDIGFVEAVLDFVDANSRLDLVVTFAGERNEYPIWVYVEGDRAPSCPAEIYETTRLDAEAKAVLERGGKVYLDAGDSDAPDSGIGFGTVGCTFSADFWSVGTFPSQEGTMGLFIDIDHPLFRDFPTESHTNYQWWPMTAGTRAIVMPDGAESIVTVMDSFAYLRNLGLLAEFKHRGGKLLVSGMGLKNLQQYPECRALLSSVYRYMDSDEFDPTQELPV